MTQRDPRDTGSTPRPRAAIIIVTHNSEAHIAACLEAVQQELLPSDVVVVVDNGSTDGTRSVLSAWTGIHVLEQENKGFGAGCNAGARHPMAAACELLVFVNPDTRVRPGWLQGLATETRPGVLTTSKVLLSSDPSQVNVFGLDLHWTGIGYVRHYGTNGESLAENEPVTGLSGSSFAVHRQDWHRLGGFAPCFFLYHEDTDLAWRAARMGMDLVAVAASEVDHAYHVTLHPSKLRHFVAGRIMLLRRHYRWFHWATLWPSLLVTDVLLLAAALGQGRTGVRAFAAGLRDGWRARVAPPRHLAAWRLVHACPKANLVAVVPTWARGPARVVQALYRINALR